VKFVFSLVAYFFGLLFAVRRLISAKLAPEVLNPGAGTTLIADLL